MIPIRRIYVDVEITYIRAYIREVDTRHIGRSDSVENSRCVRSSRLALLGRGGLSGGLSYLPIFGLSGGLSGAHRRIHLKCPLPTEESPSGNAGNTVTSLHMMLSEHPLSARDRITRIAARFSTVRCAYKLMRPGYWMYKVDLSHRASLTLCHMHSPRTVSGWRGQKVPNQPYENISPERAMAWRAVNHLSGGT